MTSVCKMIGEAKMPKGGRFLASQLAALGRTLAQIKTLSSHLSEYPDNSS